MTGLTTTTLAVGASAGAGALFVATLGVEPQQIIWAGVGSIVGSGMASEMGRLRAVAVFVSVVLLSALLGTAAAAQHYFADALLWRNTCSAICAVFFHPLLSAAVSLLPKLGEALLAFISRGAKP